MKHEQWLGAHRKFTDDQLIEYIRQFLADNDQMPPYLTIATHFDVACNAVTERLIRLEREGIFQRNAVNKLMFARISKS